MLQKPHTGYKAYMPIHNLWLMPTCQRRRHAKSSQVKPTGIQFYFP